MIEKLKDHEQITKTRLWNRISSQPDLQQCLSDLRQVAAAIGAEAARVIPGYTDHSIKHFDALWSVSDQVLTPEETENCSAGEAFILGSSFYVHDLGMAFAATKEGADILRNSDVFKNTTELLKNTRNIEMQRADVLALQIAARQLHASKARELILQPLPGLGQYLIESTDLRNKWATFIADVSASHHWSIPEVENKLGKRGKMPDAIGGSTDLAFVACALRIIDYAHINFERASYLSRLLRSEMDSDSLLHWLAQEHVTGPLRQANLLVFGSTQPIKNVEAWWLFFEMADGLDREIHLVEEYLSNRSNSVGRFSLEGVKGIRSPHIFANYVTTDGFEPVDIRFRPDSIERLVKILGGRTLYGDDVFAPIRELVQNARDAIYLQRAVDQLQGEVNAGAGQITVTIEHDLEKVRLVISDNGVGMSSDVITNYLLGIASDYWNSPSFYSEYPGVFGAGFRPAGKFGIGFLSVFMAGDKVEVETQRRSGPHLKLQLSGVGKRGALVTSPPKPTFGTTIRVEVSSGNKGLYNQIDAVVRARAPMLDMPIVVNQGTRSFTIEPEWWKTAPQDDFHDFVTQWEFTAQNLFQGKLEFVSPYAREEFLTLSEIKAETKWVGRQPEIITETSRVIALPKSSKVLVCTRGIAVTTIRVPGIVGIVEAENLELVAARSEPLQFDRNELRKRLIDQVAPKIVESLNSLSVEGSIPNRFGFIADVGSAYGPSVLLQSSLPWITTVDTIGNSVLINPLEAEDGISAAPEVILCYGPGPWSVSRVAKIHFPTASREALLLPIPTEHQASAGGYDDREEITLGKLNEHFQSYQTTPVLITTLLELISKSWKIPTNTLENIQWSRNKRNSLNAHFVRNKLS